MAARRDDPPTPADGTPMRRINGPLGDLWKKMSKTNQQQSERLYDTTGDRDNAEFEYGAWIDMCRYMGYAATEGQPNGGVDLHQLSINTEQLSAGFQSSGVLSQDLLVLIKSSKYMDDDIVATFHDPIGCIEGYFHRDVVEAIGAVLVKNTGLILRNVTVFMPVERRQQYLNVTRGNIVRIFPSSTRFADDVMAFHDEQPALLDSMTILEDPAGVATTTADLLVMTQRHVIHQNNAQRAPPPPPPHLKGKQKWAWKSFKKKAKGQQPSPTTSESPSPVAPQQPQPNRATSALPPAFASFESPSPRPPRPERQRIAAPASQPTPPTPLSPARSEASLPSVLPCRTPVHSQQDSTKQVTILLPTAATAEDVSRAIDQVLNEDDW
ncbi:Aste57867_23208 [Aphanomyces stellatus]|uniref:Aste57867_23208 protein n=1 Tax=Aphanomyces stellatus TaxID=120398 RepID=A0A485LP08_9STRA|nr:hypothetical protein As57867_023137 [Aphanomyces stellatus]VFT99855.1 Aste57867_23208 [Aphanomyces stellatus]